MVDGDARAPRRPPGQAPVLVGAASAASAGSCSQAAATHPPSHSAIRPAWAASRRQGLGRTTHSAPRSSSTAAATASGPSRPAAALVGVERGGQARVERVRRGEGDAADDGEREQHRDGRRRRAASRRARPRSAGRAAPRRRRGSRRRGPPGASRVTSDRRASTVTAARAAPATASASRSASRSCTTQCCGPGSRGASQRPIAPLPPPRSWITRRPGARRCRAQALGELLRARRRVGRLAQLEPLRADRCALIAPPPRATGDASARRPARTPATSDAVAGHRRSDARRSRAARRRRARSSASPSQRRSAAPRAAGVAGRDQQPRPGAVRRRGRGPRSPRRRRRRGPARRGPGPR